MRAIRLRKVGSLEAPYCIVACGRLGKHTHPVREPARRPRRQGARAPGRVWEDARPWAQGALQREEQLAQRPAQAGRALRVVDRAVCRLAQRPRFDLSLVFTVCSAGC
jgi:hypothetical protein